MYKNKVFDITRGSDYNVGVEKVQPTFLCTYIFYAGSDENAMLS